MIFEWVTTGVSVLVGLVTLLVAYNYIMKQSWRGLPPGPPTIPILGSLLFLPHSDTLIAFRKLAQKYGDIFTFYMGARRVVVLNGTEALNEALVKQGASLADRPDLPSLQLLGDGHGVIVTNGHRWKELRRLSLHILHNLGIGNQMFENKIISELENLVKVLEHEIGKPCYIMPLFKKSSSNLTVGMIYGSSYDSDDPMWLFHCEVLERALNAMAGSGFLNTFPFLKNIPGDYFGLMKIQTEMSDLRKLQKELVNRMRNQYNVADEPTCFVEAYLQKMASVADDPDTVFTERELLGLVNDMYAGGTDTVSTSLSWAVIFLVHYPDVQERVYQEISSVISQDEMPQMEHKKHLPYTEACVAEVQRLGDIVPTGSPRAATEDMIIRDYLIPKGTMVMGNLNSAHMDPDIWPEPTEFRPERFLDDDGKFIMRDALLTFGLGKRHCIGRSLGRMELFLYLVTIVKKFRFSPTPGHPLPDRHGNLGITYTPKPFHIYIDARY